MTLGDRLLFLWPGLGVGFPSPCRTLGRHAHALSIMTCSALVHNDADDDDDGPHPIDTLFAPADWARTLPQHDGNFEI